MRLVRSRFIHVSCALCVVCMVRIFLFSSVSSLADNGVQKTHVIDRQEKVVYSGDGRTHDAVYGQENIGKVYSPVTHGKVYSQATNGKVYSPVTHGKVYSQATNGKVYGPVTHGKVYSQATNGKVYSPASPGFNGSDYVQDILRTVNSIQKRPVMVSLINGGYLDLAYNWLCNTKHMGIHDQILIIATSEDTKRKLLTLAPTITVYVIPVAEYLDNDLDYSHVGYIRLLIIRTEILKVLVENGVELLLFEFDFLWLKNPLPVFQSYAGKYDMLFTATYGHNERTGSLNGGFFYMFPTSTTLKVLVEVNRLMKQLENEIKTWRPDKAVSEGKNDQVYLTALYNKNFAGMKGLVLSYEDFPDGKWYKLRDTSAKSWDPYTIHNNWIIGNKRKLQRAKSTGAWFLTRNNTCDKEKAKQFKLTSMNR